MTLSRAITLRFTVLSAMVASAGLWIASQPEGAPAAAVALVPLREPAPVMVEADDMDTEAEPLARDDAWLGERLDSIASPLLADPQVHRLQVLVTRIEPGDAGRRVIEHRYRADAEYFYPASAIKPFVAIAALRKLDRLRGSSGCDLDVNTPLRLCLLDGQDCIISHDATNRRGGLITVGHQIRKMLLVSNNSAFNYLYDFVGHQELNGDGAALGFSSLGLRHRIAGGATGGRSSPQVELHPRGKPPLVLPRRTSPLALGPVRAPGTDVGRMHYDDAGKLVERPADFRFKNAVSLRDLHRMLLSLVDPSLPGAVDLGLSVEDRRFVIDAMRQDPNDSDNPRYRGPRWSEERFKPILRGMTAVVPREAIDAVGKGGRAYGFELDNTYAAVENGRALFVSAVVYANPNEIVNDDGYAYHATGAFLEALGRELARTAL